METRSATILERFLETRHVTHTVPQGQKLDTKTWRYQDRHKPYQPSANFYKKVDRQPQSWTPEQVQKHAVNKSKTAHTNALQILAAKFPNLAKMQPHHPNRYPQDASKDNKNPHLKNIKPNKTNTGKPPLQKILMSLN